MLVKYAPPCIPVGCAKESLEKSNVSLGSIILSILFNENIEKFKSFNTHKIKLIFIYSLYERFFSATMFRYFEERRH
jgi:hypothetical protein